MASHDGTQEYIGLLYSVISKPHGWCHPVVEGSQVPCFIISPSRQHGNDELPSNAATTGQLIIAILHATDLIDHGTINNTKVAR